MKETSLRYKIQCPYCKKDAYIEKSSGMEVGMTNTGLSTCLYCKKMIVLQYNPTNDTMEAITKEKYKRKHNKE